MKVEETKFDNKIIEEMSQGKYPETIIETKYGEFIVKYPTRKDENLIERRKALQLNGLPLHSFSDGFVYDNHRDVTLSVLITTYPENFNEAWKKEGLDEFPDKEVLDSIYKEFKKFSQGIKDQISGKSSS